MPVSWKVRWSATALVVFCLAGCTSDGGATPRAAGSPVPDGGASGRALSKEPRSITCISEEAHAQAKNPLTGEAITVGAISWPGLKSWATADPKHFGSGTDGFYKVGARIKAGSAVTVSVAESSDSEAGLKYGQQWEYEAVQSVTFQGCEGYDTVYFGGFYAPDRECVPLDVSEAGRPPVRVTVSFFAGPCE